jgi:glutaredoxin 3
VIPAMRAELYTTAFCPFCRRAKQLLEQHHVPYVEHAMDGKPEELREVKRRYGHPTVPIVILDGEFIGGCDELERLARTRGLGGSGESLSGR